jgi:hypothetical protein
MRFKTEGLSCILDIPERIFPRMKSSAPQLSGPSQGSFFAETTKWH